MKTKKLFTTAITIGTLTVGFWLLPGCSSTETAHDHSAGHVHQYTCPMHSEVVTTAPGNCPKCGMKLVEKH